MAQVPAVRAFRVVVVVLMSGTPCRRMLATLVDHSTNCESTNIPGSTMWDRLPSGPGQDLPGIHESGGVDGALHGRAEVELGLALEVRNRVPFRRAHAVLGADAAATCRHRLIDDVGQLVAQREERRGVRPRRAAQVVVQVAVADVAVGDETDAG